MEPGYQQKFFYHRVPKVEDIASGDNKTTNLKNSWFIGIIDSSGSMNSCWPFVKKFYNELIEELDLEKVTTMCFDTSVHPVPEKKLKDKLSAHGGGCTDIYKPFVEFEKIISKIPEGEEIKVLFISDGCDNCNNNLEQKLKTLNGNKGRSVSFMCLGVQKGFPTFISMQCREIYHNADQSIPSIFLIEYSSEKAFFNKFQAIKPFLTVLEEIKLDPEQFLFPWEAVSPAITENKWIVSEDNQISVRDGAMTLTYDDNNFSVEGITDIFRSWTQKLQLDSINKRVTPEKTQEFAESTYNLMNEIATDIFKSKGLKLIVTEEDSNEIKNFKESVIGLQVKRTGLRIQGYFDSVKALKDGLNLQKLSEFEAAKIIGLGTVVGKHQQRAMAMNNITKDKFKTMVSEFTTVLDSLELNNETSSSPALTTGKTLLSIFKDDSLKAGLSLIESPIYFLELFSLVGLPVKLKRNDGCDKDPWNVVIQDFSKTTKAVDASQFDLATHKLTIKEGAEEVEYTGFVPLLGEKDQQLAALFDTSLVKYALSYNLTFEIDSIFDESYFILLANLYKSIAKNTDETSEAIKDQIYWSLKAISGQKPFSSLLQAFKTGDASQFASFKNLEAFYLVAFYLSREDDSQESWQGYGKILWMAYWGEVLKTKPINQIAISSDISNMKETMLKKFTGEYLLKRFYTPGELRRFANNKMDKEIQAEFVETGNSNCEINKSIYTVDTNDCLNFELTNKIISGKTGKPMDDDLLMVYLAHCLKYHSLQERVANALNEDLTQAKNEISSHVSKKNTKNKGVFKKWALELLPDCMKNMKEEFLKTHRKVEPISYEELKKECEARNIDISKLDYNPATGLCKNCCMCKTCPWYLIVRKEPRSLRSHLGNWGTSLMKGFHLYISNNKSKSAEEIYKEFITKEQWKVSANQMTEKDCLDYISQVKECLA